MDSRNKKTAIVVMILTFLVLLVTDLVLTLSFGDLVKYLEANPAYQYVGILGIIAINLILITIVYWLYKKSNNPTTRFYYVNLLVTICITRIFVIINNIQVLLDPPTLEQAKQFAAQTTTAMKTVAVAKIGIVVVIPYFIAIITYWIWSLDHKVEIKEKNG